LEYHSLVSIQEDTAFDVPADGARQDDFFDVAALLDQVVDGVAVVDADDILFDDGAIVAKSAGSNSTRVRKRLDSSSPCSSLNRMLPL